MGAPGLYRSEANSEGKVDREVVRDALGVVCGSAARDILNHGMGNVYDVCVGVGAAHSTSVKEA